MANIKQPVGQFFAFKSFWEPGHQFPEAEYHLSSENRADFYQAKQLLEIAGKQL